MPTEEYSLEDAADHIADLRGQVDQLNEVHPLGSTTPPQAVASGAQLYAANGNPAYVGSSGLQMGLTGAQPAFFPGLTNPGASTSLVSMGSFTIPANDADIGAVYELEIWGNGTQGATQQALGLQVVLGGNNLATVTFGTNAAGGANSAFRFRVAGRAICQTTGVGGLWTTYIDATVALFQSTAIAVGNADFATAFSCESTNTQAVDTTAAITLGVSAAWGGTTTTPSITSRVAIAKRIC